MANSTTAERIGQFWIFEGFSSDECAEIAKLTEVQTFDFGQTLFKQEDEPEFFYLVQRGVVQAEGTDPFGKIVLRRRVEAGDFVGHRSLMDGTHHRATATVVPGTHLLAIKAADFKALLAAFPKLQERLKRTQVVNRLLATPLFGCFSRDRLFHVADLARVVAYPAGQTIFRPGEEADAFYVMDTGQVKLNWTGSLSARQDWPRVLTAGSFFGRRDLLDSAPRRSTAEAIADTRLFRFNADAFHWLCELQPAFRQALTRPNIVAHLQQMPLFSKLRKEELDQLAGYVGLAHYPAGEILYRQGEVDPTLYILYDGEAVLRARDEQGRDRPSGYVRPGDAIGETSLFLQDPRDATLEPVIDTNWFYLTREDLDEFLAQRPDARDKLILKEEVKTRQRLSRFPWMDPGEQFVLRDRRHWFFLTNSLILPAFVLLLALVLSVLDLPRIIIFLILAIAGLWMLWRVVDWANDYYIVTTKRVAHREKVLGIRETRDETPLDKIQNVNIERGLFGNLFGFGTLIIDTAAAAGVTRVTFNYLGKPERVQSLVFEQMSRLRAGQRSETRRAIRDRLEDGIGLSVRPVVPRPAVPSAVTEPPAPPTPGIGAQLYDVIWGRRFWIERRADGQIIWRKHWIRLIRRIWMPVLVIFGLLLILAFFLAQTQKLWGFIALLIGLLIPALGWFWWNWTDWGNDQYIVTNDRIIDTDQLPLGFRSRRTETTFDRIQNVSFEIPHPVATLLNYGTVVIFTAGVEGQLDFEYVRDPKGVQAEIFRRLMAYQEAQHHEQREQSWEDLPHWFATYEEMHRS